MYSIAEEARTGEAYNINPSTSKPAGLSILLCLTPDDLLINGEPLGVNGLTHRHPHRPKPARLSILLCLTPDDFTRQWTIFLVNGEPLAGSQWVKRDFQLHEKSSLHLLFMQVIY